MPTLVVRNVPDPLHEQLKAHTLANHRSVTKEVIALIEQALKHRARTPVVLPAPIPLRDGPATTDWMEGAIHDGRE